MSQLLIEITAHFESSIVVSRTKILNCFQGLRTFHFWNSNFHLRWKNYFLW
jgi:hypothetical protein